MKKQQQKNANIFSVLKDKGNRHEKEVVEVFLQRYRDVEFSGEDLRVMRAIERTKDITGYDNDFIVEVLMRGGISSSSPEGLVHSLFD